MLHFFHSYSLQTVSGSHCSSQSVSVLCASFDCITPGLPFNGPLHFLIVLALCSPQADMVHALCRILTEDKGMVEQLRPEMLPREVSVKADLPQIAFRKLRQEYIDMGYGVLPEASENRYRGADQ